jgi:hypothetical protein
MAHFLVLPFFTLRRFFGENRGGTSLKGRWGQGLEDFESRHRGQFLAKIVEQRGYFWERIT